ncbi:lysine exporter LysO family protein [Natranaerobius thermophilus]|uniref:Lysine exporter LysO family protein n=1 Tax=Natranaerobius thermophilus (strain ATCC BAA-1301 / DSM 18059 / JW/NM-WN-LF) TaxID=457570 RepID=B2A1A3_NATTJ|nr:lysine exporter LysO family protein [Natranaerobius thermophilus]ACB86041.1 protein of unknown function DUF340 membrane [Natranaerobius thermophilus JW/NM-WN-LF]
MWWIILPLIVGLIISLKLPSKVTNIPISKIINCSIYVLLFVMGIRLGADPEVMEELSNLGAYAFVIAVVTIIGSLIVLFGLNKVVNLKFSSEQVDYEEDEWDETGAEYTFTVILVLLVIAGTIFGWLFVSDSFLPVLDSLTTWILGMLLFGVGLDLGMSRSVFENITNQGIKFLILCLATPLGVVFGTVLAGVVLALFTDFITWNEGAALASGFGWYSLSAVIISEVHSPLLGAVGFLANIFREILAIIFTPIIAKYLGGVVSIAPGGATTMDVTLPIISKSAGKEFIPIAFFNGLILSLLVPILVNFFVAL